MGSEMRALKYHIFADRADAGRQLADRLRKEQWIDPVVLGMVRGGVPVAAEVAQELGTPLDVAVSRKIGAWPSRVRRRCGDCRRSTVFRPADPPDAGAPAARPGTHLRTRAAGGAAPGAPVPERTQSGADAGS